MSTRILVLLATGFEEIEMVTPVDLLKRAGAEIVLATLSSDKLVTGRSGITVKADAFLDDLAVENFDALLIPGGPGVTALHDDGRPTILAQEFFKANKPVAAICAAPTLLRAAGLLHGKKFTAHFSVQGELPTALVDERVLTDGLLTTSRGAGTALDFGLELVRRFYGEEKASEIAASIMV